jgi:hypothetical protein
VQVYHTCVNMKFVVLNRNNAILGANWQNSVQAHAEPCTNRLVFHEITYACPYYDEEQEFNLNLLTLNTLETKK